MLELTDVRSVGFHLDNPRSRAWLVEIPRGPGHTEPVIDRASLWPDELQLDCGIPDLIVVESMKMEQIIKSDYDGIVDVINVDLNEQVSAGKILMTIS